VRGQPHSGRAVPLHEVAEPGEGRTVDPADDRGGPDVEPAVLLRVHADVVGASEGGLGRGAVDQLPPEVLVLEHLAELRDAPVGDEELQPGLGPQPAVAVVTEDAGDAGPRVRDLVERDPDTELLREPRVHREAAADPQVEAGAVLGVDGADEGHVVDAGHRVVARVTAGRGLELPRQVRELRVADVAPLDLLQRRGGVDDLVGRDAGDRRAEERAGGVAAGFQRGHPDGVEPLPDLRDVLDLDPVVLDVLPVGDVGGAAGEVGGDAAEGVQLGGAEQGAVGADPHHEVAVVELLLLEEAGLAAVDARLALGVEAHPPEAPAQVGGVDGVEATPGVDVQDAVPHVQRVVVLLGLLVLVQRLGVAQRPLALRAPRTRDVGVARRLGLEAQVRHGFGPSLKVARDAARVGGERGCVQRGQHIMLRVRPRST
jgi:hypothetical protein